MATASVGWAQDRTDGVAVDSVVRTAEARENAVREEYRLKRDYAVTPIDLDITLPVVTAAQQAELMPEEPASPGPLQIGFGRDLPAAYSGDLAPRLTWETRSDGTVVSALSVSSPGAAALRVAVRATLPDGGEIRFFSPADPEQRFPPVDQDDFPASGEVLDEEAGDIELGEEGDPTYWSPVLNGETAGAEISLPSAASVTEVELFIDRVSHHTLSLRSVAPQNLNHVGRAASCQVDVACGSLTSTEWNSASATAKISYIKDDASFLCSGTLMADTDNSSTIPYFLTANHCINTQTVAGTLVTYWDFERAACNRSVPTREHQLAVQGTVLLATDS